MRQELPGPGEKRAVMNTLKTIIFSLLAFLFILSAAVPASYTSLPLSALVAESDTIALGTLKDFKIVSERMAGGTTVRTCEGALQVEEILLGDGTETMKLRWTVVPGLSSSFNPEEMNDKRGIWLLAKNTDANGVSSLTMTHPGRFVEAEKLAVVKSLLQKPIYRIALKSDEYTSGKPLMATFTILALKDEVKAESFLKVQGGKLVFCGTARIHISNGTGEVKMRDEHTAVAPSHEVVTVKKGNPLKVDIDLSRYFNLRQEGSHTIWWGSSYELSSPRCTFYTQEHK